MDKAKTFAKIDLLQKKLNETHVQSNEKNTGEAWSTQTELMQRLQSMELNKAIFLPPAQMPPLM